MNARHSAIAYKRDIGLGGGPVAGLPRVIDLWWQLAGRLGVPYDDGQWSGPVRVGRPAQAGAGDLLGAESYKVTQVSRGCLGLRGPDTAELVMCVDRPEVPQT